MTCLRLALVADTSLTVHLPLSLAYRSTEITATMRHAYIELAKYLPEGFANEGKDGEEIEESG